MDNREVIIPEVIQEHRKLNKVQDINLNQYNTNNFNYNSKKQYNNIDNSTHEEINTQINNRGLIMSLFIFIFKLLMIPFNIFMFFRKRYIKNKKPVKKQSKFFKKWLKNNKSLYLKDEIY